MNPNRDITDELVVQFFRKLKRELNESSTGKIVAQVRRIVSKLRIGFSVSDMTEIVNKTPALFHWVLIGNSRYDVNERRAEHLDELVAALRRDDLRTGDKLFRSEIETLGTVIVILRRLMDFLSSMGVRANILSYTLSGELRQAVIGEAA